MTISFIIDLGRCYDELRSAHMEANVHHLFKDRQYLVSTQSFLPASSLQVPRFVQNFYAL